MIICASLKDENTIDMRFGRCAMFGFYDTETKQTKYVENQGKIQSNGAGIKAAKQVIDENANYVITEKVGPNAFDVLEGASVKIFESKQSDFMKAVKEVLDNELSSIEASNGEKHGGLA